MLKKTPKPNKRPNINDRSNKNMVEKLKPFVRVRLFTQIKLN